MFVRCTKPRGGNVFFRADKIVCVEDRESGGAKVYVAEPTTEAVLFAVQESAEDIMKQVVAFLLYGSEGQCDVAATTIGQERPCVFVRGHSGDHSWVGEN